MPDAKDVILKHIAAFNDRDSDAEPWAADAEMAAPGAQVSGRDDVIGFLGAFHEAFPDGCLEVKQILSDGPAAAVEGTFVGTMMACSTPPTAMSRRQDEPLSSGGRRSMRQTATR